MKATVSRWGNSLAVRIPKDALKEAGLREGDRLDIVAEKGCLVLAPRTMGPSLDELIARITPENLQTSEFADLVGAERW